MTNSSMFDDLFVVEINGHQSEPMLREDAVTYCRENVGSEPSELEDWSIDDYLFPVTAEKPAKEVL